MQSTSRVLQGPKASVILLIHDNTSPICTIHNKPDGSTVVDVSVRGVIKFLYIDFNRDWRADVYKFLAQWYPPNKICVVIDYIIVSRKTWYFNHPHPVFHPIIRTKL
jgi:hypothetical protein